MLGAIAGDIIGSVLEFKGEKNYDFELFMEGSHFTDDTILSVAVMDVLLNNKGAQALDYKTAFQYYARKYPSSYGGRFHKWRLSENPQPYESFGNGSAMRVSPIAYISDDIKEVLREVELSCLPTHNHIEGIKGAGALATAIFLAKQNRDKEEIRSFIAENFGYDMDRTVEEIRPEYKFDVTCQGSVPESIIAFLDSEDFEDSIRLACSLGGDVDTQAAMTGSIAEAYYGIPFHITETVFADYLPTEFIHIVKDFYSTHNIDF